MLGRIVRGHLGVKGARSLSYTHNLHQPPAYYVDGHKHINDYDIEEYRP